MGISSIVLPHKGIVKIDMLKIVRSLDSVMGAMSTTHSQIGLTTYLL